MSKTVQEIGRIERFWEEHPPSLSAALTAVFLGFAGVCAELFLYPIMNNQPINWGLTIGSMLSTPLYFIVFYVIFRSLYVFRRIGGVHNWWDRKIGSLFRWHPIIVFTILAPVAGFTALSRDFVAWLLTGSSMGWSTIVFVFIVLMISFVVCCTMARKELQDPTEPEST